MSLREFFREIAMFGQEFDAGNQNGGRDIFFVHENFAARFALQPRNPRLNGPDSIDLFLLEQRQLIGILRRQNLRVTAELRDFQAARRQPRATGNILRVPELRRRNFLSAKICGRFQILVRLHHQRRAAVGRSRDQADFGAVRFRISIQGRARADVSEIDRVGEDRFHRARAGIVNEPLDLGARAEPLLEPAFPLPREIVRHERLGVRDIWEMPDAQDDVFRRFHAADERDCN